MYVEHHLEEYYYFKRQHTKLMMDGYKEKENRRRHILDQSGV